MCDYCIRPELSKLTPKADEDGQPLSDWESLEFYNERRYSHYLTDFNDRRDLAKHLHERIQHFADTANSDDDRAAIKASALAANSATLEWWGRARKRTERHAGQPVEAKQKSPGP